MTDFQRALLEWYDREKRDLPWRKTKDPYAIWVSEAMLQQTQVKTATPHYERWMARFPTIADLAQASEEDALAIWQGLGYYRRCRQLLAGAKAVQASGMPQTRAGLLELPGVGPYTASAIASIAFGEPVAVVDGNVERVYARLNADGERDRLKSKAQSWADENLVTDRPGDWNQAVMELGATVCTPKKPACLHCPVRRFCDGKLSPERFPGPKPKVAPVLLEHTVLVAFSGEAVLMRKIPEGEWWQGMWESLRASGSGDETLPDLLVAAGARTARYAGSFKHAVTKHRITVDVHVCEAGPSELEAVPLSELASRPMPAPQRRALKMALHARESGLE